jgi:hypothetical protein
VLSLTDRAGLNAHTDTAAFPPDRQEPPPKAGTDTDNPGRHSINQLIKRRKRPPPQSVESPVPSPVQQPLVARLGLGHRAAGRVGLAGAGVGAERAPVVVGQAALAVQVLRVLRARPQARALGAVVVELFGWVVVGCVWGCVCARTWRMWSVDLGEEAYTTMPTYVCVCVCVYIIILQPSVRRP